MTRRLEHLSCEDRLKKVQRRKHKILVGIVDDKQK